jgi:hypothetical protein
MSKQPHKYYTIRRRLWLYILMKADRWLDSIFERGTGAGQHGWFDEEASRYWPHVSFDQAMAELEDDYVIRASRVREVLGK